MKTLITLLVVFIIFNAYPQTDLTIDLYLHDNFVPPYGGDATISFGLDSTATDGIDPQLGEMQLPSDGCPTWWPYFCAKFILPPFDGLLDSYKDYRFGELPFTGQKEHRIFCVTDDSIVTIEYNLPPGVVLFLSDILGGLFFNSILIYSGNITVPYEYFLGGEIKMIAYYNNVGGEPTNEPVFSMAPTSLNFGEVAYGESETLPVLIANAGYLDSLNITNAVSFDPAFTFEPNTFPIILAPGQPQIFNITYTGSIEVEHIDSILFYHNASGSPSKLNVFAETLIPNPNCVAQVLCDVTITSGGIYDIRQLKFGLDSTATDDIDPWLGESGPLPPFPPPGAFDARFFLPENNFSGTLTAYCDFRFATFPFTGQKEWRLAYQANFGDAITISWDFPGYMTGTLLDILNGTFINEPMVGSGSYTVTDPINFNRLRMIIDFNITTPVELISFTAEMFENVVKLNWATATETNNSGFEIERDLPQPLPKEGAIQTPLPLGKGQGDGLWETIGFVPGFGTTTEPKSYSFTDEHVTSGTYKYRLKQIDFDGTLTYSNEIEFEVDFTPKEFVLYQNYPNPFNPVTSIQYSISSRQFVTLIVYDVLGKEVTTLVNDEKQPGVYEVEFNASNLSTGIYFYQLKAGSFVQTKKMILAK